MVMRKMGCYWGWLIFHTVLMTIWWWLFPAVNLRLNLYVVFDGFWHMWGTIVVDLCGPGHGHMTSAESPRSRVSSRAISHPERMEARNGWLVTMCDGQYFFRSYEEHWRSRVMKNNGIWMECIYIYMGYDSGRLIRCWCNPKPLDFHMVLILGYRGVQGCNMI